MTTLGLMLLGLGAALAVVEAHVSSYGIVGTGAVIALAARSAGEHADAGGAGGGLAVGLAVAFAAASVGGVYLAFVLGRVIVARGAPVRGGRAGLIGHRGELQTVPAPVGRVLVDGELWRARAWDGDELRTGDPVIVEYVDGLTLTVRRAEEWEVMP